MTRRSFILQQEIDHSKAPLRASALNRQLGRFVKLMALALCLSTMTGCPRDEVVQYRLPKEEVANTNSSTSAEPQEPTHRMLAGTVIGEESVWFFKVSASIEAVANVEKEVREFMASITFPNGLDDSPQWQLPEGWKATGGNQFRFETLKIGSATPALELTISKLPMQQGRESYLRDNFNRWRGQLGLPPSPDINADGQLESAKTNGGKTELLVFDLIGSGGGAGMPPMMGRGGSGAGLPPGGVSSAPPTSSGNSNLPFTLTTPAGWKELPGSSITLAKFEISEGGMTANVTVTPLPSSNQWAGNVVRWAGQVGAEGVNAAAIEKLSKKVDVGGIQADYVELSGNGDSPSRQAIFGVMAVKESTAWFIKLSGPYQVVSAQKEKFSELLASFEFK